MDQELSEIEALQKQLMRIKEIVKEKDQLLEEACSKTKTQERVIQYLRERSEGAHLEIHHLQHELDVTLEKIQTVQLAKQSIREKEQAQHEREKMRELLQQKEKVLEDSKSHLQLYIQEKRQLEEKLNFAKTAFKESEEQLRLAEQHLAKKLKEATELSEANQKMRKECVELKKMIENFQSQSQVEKRKSAEAESILNVLRKEKESLKAKSQLLQTQLSDALQKINEFQKLESQHNQLKFLLTAMKEGKNSEVNEKESDLFSQDKSSQYYKTSLFE